MKTMIDIFFDDIVDINGIVGYVDFIGSDIIAIVDDAGTMHKIRYDEIKTARTISACFRNPINGRCRIEN